MGRSEGQATGLTGALNPIGVGLAEAALLVGVVVVGSVVVVGNVVTVH